jgi:hypothetical protein
MASLTVDRCTLDRTLRLDRKLCTASSFVTLSTLAISGRQFAVCIDYQADSVPLQYNT